MRPLPPKEQRIILKSLEAQGCKIEETDKGWRIKFPDGVGTASLHKSQGDRRSRENLRAEIRRAGLKWPFDHHHRKKKGT
jgi:hypothetical protein